MFPLDLHPHHRNSRYTLRGIYRDSSAALQKDQELTREGLETYAFSGPSPKGTVLHFVAARHNVLPLSRSGLPQKHSADWEATRMAIQTFRDALRKAKKRGNPTRWYKALEIEGVHACIRGFHWKGSCLGVAGRILSSTILRHPFPNANHRTALGLTRLYLGSVGIRWPRYTLKGQGEKRFERDARPFLRDSKYLLQLFRHRSMIKVAVEEGFTHLLIGDAVTVEIRSADLGKRREDVAQAHFDRCCRFVKSLTGIDSIEAIGGPNPQGLRGWIEWYKA